MIEVAAASPPSVVVDLDICSQPDPIVPDDLAPRNCPTCGVPCAWGAEEATYSCSKCAKSFARREVEPLHTTQSALYSACGSSAH